MMEIAGVLKTAAASAVAIGTIGGSAYVLDERHFPMEQGIAMQSANRVGTILELVAVAQRDGRSDWICEAIDKEIIALCTEQASHYLCTNPAAAKDLKAKAGC